MPSATLRRDSTCSSTPPLSSAAVRSENGHRVNVGVGQHPVEFGHLFQTPQLIEAVNESGYGCDC